MCRQRGQASARAARPAPEASMLHLASDAPRRARDSGQIDARHFEKQLYCRHARARDEPGVRQRRLNSTPKAAPRSDRKRDHQPTADWRRVEGLRIRARTAQIAIQSPPGSR